MLEFFTWMWNEDWLSKVMAVFLALSIVALVALIVCLPWIYQAEKRETERLLATGCEVTDTETTYVLISTGRTTILTPVTHETWGCPDGTIVER